MVEGLNPSGRIVSAVAVTPHDTTENKFDALYVGTSGNLVVRCSHDTANVTFTNVQSGAILPVNVQLVLSTNTTASNIVGLRIAGDE